jgi:hypothetical protein
MSTIGKGAAIGGFCGYALANLAIGLTTQSGQAALLLGLLTGLPLGTAIGIFTEIAVSRNRNRTDTVLWITVAVVLILLVAVVAAIMLLNAKNMQ